MTAPHVDRGGSGPSDGSSERSGGAAPPWEQLVLFERYEEPTLPYDDVVVPLRRS